MEIIAFLIAVSGSLAALAVVFFVWLVREQSHEHADRLSLLPIDEESPNPQPNQKEP